MRTILPLIFLLLSLSVARAEITLAWDANPEADIAQYRLYELADVDDPASATLLGVVAAPETQFTRANMTFGTHWIVVTARNTVGLESPQSVALEIVVPSQPQNLRILVTATVSVERNDGGGWVPVASVTEEVEGLANILLANGEVQ